LAAAGDESRVAGSTADAKTGWQWSGVPAAASSGLCPVAVLPPQPHPVPLDRDAWIWSMAGTSSPTSLERSVASHFRTLDDTYYSALCDNRWTSE